MMKKINKKATIILILIVSAITIVLYIGKKDGKNINKVKSVEITEDNSVKSDLSQDDIQPDSAADMQFVQDENTDNSVKEDDFQSVQAVDKIVEDKSNISKEEKDSEQKKQQNTIVSREPNQHNTAPISESIENRNSVENHGQDKPKNESTQSVTVSDASAYIGNGVGALVSAIGNPISKNYASSCIGDGQDGEWIYQGFTVYTYRDTNGNERVEDVIAN